MGLLDLIYPENLYCSCCGDSMESSRVHGLCDNCIAQIDWQTGNPFRSVMEDFSFYDVWPCCRYGFFARRIIFALKQDGQRHIARGIGLLLAERAEAGIRGGARIDALVPVPMHPEKQRKRGFNQSALLARYAAQALGLPLWDVLEKPNPTQSMRLSDGITRRNLLQGAFRVKDKAKLSGESLLLVDDVLTTGSTADACAKALLFGGAERVFVLCFAAAAGVSWSETLRGDQEDRRAGEGSIV